MLRGSKIILDTNIWVSLALNRNLKFIADLKNEHQIIIYSCDELRTELFDVINRPKFDKILDESSKSRLFSFFDLVTNVRSVSLDFQGSPDPKDDFLFDLGIQCQVDFLITGDKKLLEFNFPNFRIISLNQFKESI